MSVNKIVKPYEWKGTINSHPFEISKQGWDDAWEFINNLLIDEDIKTFIGCEVYGFMKHLSTKYPYKNVVFSSLFDGISEDEFAMYLNEKYNIKTRTKVTETTYIVG